MSSFRQTWMWPFVLFSLPAVGWFFYALATGYTLENDKASMAIRTFDIFSANRPLLGMPSTASMEVQGSYLFHPGPTQFWLMAPIYALSGWNTWGLFLGSLFVNLGLAGVGFWAAYRIGSAWVKWAVVSTFGVVLVGLQFVWFEPWNPFPVIIGFVTLVILSWGITIGQRGWWPIAIFVGSVVAQAHLVSILFVLPLLLLVVGLGHRFRWASNCSTKEIIASILVLLLCWAGPLREMLSNWPGNVGQFVSYILSSAKPDDAAQANQGPGLVSLMLVVSFGVFAWVGFRRAVSYLKANQRGNVPTEKNVVATGLLITSALMAVFGAAIYFFGGSRGIYLGMFVGVWVLHVFLMKPRDREWWNQPLGASSRMMALMFLGITVFSLIGAGRFEDALANKPIVEATRELVSRTGNKSILVRQVGIRAQMWSGPAVIADLLVSRHDVYFNHYHFADRVDYDAQRRIEHAPDSRFELYVIQRNDDSTWPQPDDGKVIDSREIDVPHWDTRIRLILVDKR